jgi:hypothetical protein
MPSGLRGGRISACHTLFGELRRIGWGRRHRTVRYNRERLLVSNALMLTAGVPTSQSRSRGAHANHLRGDKGRRHPGRSCRKRPIESRGGVAPAGGAEVVQPAVEPRHEAPDPPWEADLSLPLDVSGPSQLTRRA